MTRVVMVTGSRDEDVSDSVHEALSYYMPTVVLVGCCPTGADRAARLWCKRRGVACPVLHADWSKGKIGGPARNTHLVTVAAMLGAFVLAFPRGGPGTADCMRKAKRAKLEIVEL